MHNIRTSQGNIDWQLGDLAGSRAIFLYDYCSNFAHVLACRKPELEIYGIFQPSGLVDHYLCKDDKSFLDIRGRLIENELLADLGEGTCESIELEELEQNWEEEWDYLAESIIDEYISKLGL